jgi:hypothetical protein
VRATENVVHRESGADLMVNALDCLASLGAAGDVPAGW